MEMNSTLLGPENLRKQQIELAMELVKGKEYANQLRAILHKNDGDGLALAEELAQKILRSFTDSIAKTSLCRTEDLGQIKKDLGEGSKKRPAEMMKDKRGSYKRRKEVISRVIVSPTIEDGYMWRKYGQKEIQNSKQPRCYFRCTHKFDQDCKALKQVQKLEEEEKNMYQITYFNQHICRDQTRAQIISDSEVTESTSMIDFRKKIPASKLMQNIPPRNNTYVPSMIKQESNGDTQSDNVSSIDSNSMWPAFVGTKDYSPTMGSFHDQEVASNLYDRHASPSFECLDIKTLIGDEFPDFSYYDEL